MRLATWNVNSVGPRLPRLLDWLATRSPDVAALQETKIADDAFPRAEVERLGYEVAAHGSGRWNGVALLSRVGLDDVEPGLAGAPGFPEVDSPPEARSVTATCGGVRVRCVYVPNGRTPDDPHYAYKLRWLEALRTAVTADVAAHERAVVCGDVNVARTDADVFDPRAYVGSTHVTPPERAAIDALVELGLVDVVPRPGKGPNPFTYWDYRAGMFHQDKGMRIDLVLASAAVADDVRDAWVDREARKGKLPSDHAPVVVDLGEDRDL